MTNYSRKFVKPKRRVRAPRRADPISNVKKPVETLLQKQETDSRMLKRQKQMLGLACALALPVLSGCVAYNFSSEFLPVKAGQGHERRFQHLDLGVELPGDKSPDYHLEKLVENLRETGLFKSVEYVNRASAVDLVLTQFSYRREDPYRACILGFEGQILTIATVGVVPQVCQAEHGMDFVIYAAKDKQRKKTLSFSYTTRSVVGWAALFYAPSSEWKFQPAKERYSELLKAVFYREADNIERLLR